MQNINIKNKISSLIPEHIKSDYPEFVVFMSAYLEWIENQENPVGVIRNFKSNHDLDTSIDTYVKYFKDSIIPQIPDNAASDKQLFLKHIQSIKSSKGSENSFKMLFRIIFNEEIEMYYPKEDIFRWSSGNWIKNQVEIFVTTINNPSLFNNKNITQDVIIDGKLKTNSGIISNITLDSGKYQYAKLVLSDVVGEFVYGFPLKINNKEYTEYLYPTISTIDISNDGFSYLPGDKVVLPEGRYFEINKIVNHNIKCDLLVNTKFQKSDLVVEVNGVDILQDFEFDGRLLDLSSSAGVFKKGDSVKAKLPSVTGSLEISKIGTLGQISDISFIDSPVGFNNVDPISNHKVFDSFDHTPVYGKSTTTGLTQRLGIMGLGNPSVVMMPTPDGVVDADDRKAINSGYVPQIGSPVSSSIIQMFEGQITSGGLQFTPTQLHTDRLIDVDLTGSPYHIIDSSPSITLEYITVDIVNGWTRFRFSEDVSSAIFSMRVGDVDANLSGLNKISQYEWEIPRRLFEIIPNLEQTFGFSSTAGSVTIISDNGAVAELSALSGGYRNIAGRWADSSGWFSSNKFWQDGDYYQDYSYVIKSSQGVDVYKDVVDSLIHPSGTKMFGEIGIFDMLSLFITVDDYSKAIVYEYMPESYKSLGPMLLNIEEFKERYKSDTYPASTFHNIIVSDLYTNPNFFKSMNLDYGDFTEFFFLGINLAELLIAEPIYYNTVTFIVPSRFQSYDHFPDGSNEINVPANGGVQLLPELHV